MSIFSTEKLESLECCFVVDFDTSQEAFLVDAKSPRIAPIEPKENGAGIAVTLDNLEEYLQLYVEHRLVGAIKQQVKAVRDGLDVFVNDALRTNLRSFLTVAEFQ